MMQRNTVHSAADVPALQYASGRTEARAVGQSRFVGHVGFHAEVGRDEALDLVCHDLNVPVMEIRHPRDGGQPVIAKHWDFGEQVMFHPITNGPPYDSIYACLRTRETAEAGLGLVWPQGERSRFAVRGLLRIEKQFVLMQLSTKSTMTAELLAALIDHVRVCVEADALIDRAKHPDVVMLHEIALPLAAGLEKAVGKGETTLITPFNSNHPDVIDAAYLRGVWRSEAMHTEAMNAWESIVAWAQEFGTAAAVEQYAA